MAKTYKVCIDPGHGGSNPGAVNGKRYEKDDVLRLALAVKPLLEQQGVAVLMTRETDKSVPLATRCSMANSADCDYFISLHRDAASATANGASAWVWTKAGTQTISQARAILDKVVAASSMTNRGVSTGTPQNYTDFAVNSGTDMASVLLEVGFVTSEADNRKFDECFRKLAVAIASGICDVLGIPYNGDASEAPPQSDSGYIYRVYEQIGAYSNPENAREAAKGKKAIVRYEPK